MTRIVRFHFGPGAPGAFKWRNRTSPPVQGDAASRDAAPAKAGAWTDV